MTKAIAASAAAGLSLNLSLAAKAGEATAQKGGAVTVIARTPAAPVEDNSGIIVTRYSGKQDRMAIPAETFMELAGTTAKSDMLSWPRPDIAPHDRPGAPGTDPADDETPDLSRNALRLVSMRLKRDADEPAPPPQPVQSIQAVEVPVGSGAPARSTSKSDALARQAAADPAAAATPAADAAPPSVSPASGSPSPQPEPVKTAALTLAPGEIMWSNSGKSGAAAKTVPGAGRINSTGRDMEMEAPVRDGKFHLGDLPVRISASDEISVPKERLLQIVKPLLRGPAFEKLQALPDNGGYLRLADLTAAGYDFQFDAGLIELQVNPNIEQRARGALRAGYDRSQVKSENLAKPALFAAYMNMRMGADYTTSEAFTAEDQEVAARADFEGAARWFGVVMESRATLESDGAFSRRGTRFIYDLPDDAIRVTAGDVSPLKTSYQGGSDLLGVTVEKSYQKLQPGQNIHPTGSRSFRVERPSDVDVVINGRVTQRLQLRPGDYDINDLPLSAGANEITLVITDDVGNKRTLNYTVFSGRSLLAAGVSEWAVSGGIATRYDSAGEPGLSNLFSQLDYDFAAPVMTGYYQRGLTDDLTGELHFQADGHSQMGGAGAFFQTSFGFFALEGALSSNSESGLGYSGQLSYDLANIEGKDGIKRSFRFATEYRSEEFAVVDVLDPVNDTMLSVAASYTQELPWQLSGSVSARYSVRRESADAFGVDLNLSRSFGPAVSAGLNVGYDQSGEDDGDSRLPEGFKAAIRLNYRLNENANIDASHDAHDGHTQVSYRQQHGSGLESWNSQVELDHQGASVDGDDTIGINGSASYLGNRAEVGVSHHTGFVGFEGETTGQRTSVTAGTAIAFADGAAAIGRPVSNSFAIVGLHDNLADGDVTIGASKDGARASSDFLGPALVSDLSPYSTSRLPYDVDKLPVGYDLGAGGFDLFAAYKSGYRFTVGSDYTVTAFGSLIDEKGEPVALLTGVAFQESLPDAQRVTVFTNKAGRFGAQGLRPGRWIIEMATEPKTRYVIDVPKDTVGLLRLDALKPAKSGS